MTRVDLAKLAYRLLALYFFLRAMIQVPNLVLFWLFDTDTGGAQPYVLAMLAGSGVLAVVSAAAFLGAGTLARWTFRDESPVLPAWNPSAVMRIGLALIGAWAVVNALPTIVGLGVPFLLEDEVSRVYAVRGLRTQLPLAVAQLAIGLLLFLQAGGLARLWERMQGFGLQPTDLHQPDPPTQENP